MANCNLFCFFFLFTFPLLPGCTLGLLLLLPDAVSRPSGPAPDRHTEGRSLCRAAHADRIHVQGRGKCRILSAFGTAKDGKIAQGKARAGAGACERSTGAHDSFLFPLSSPLPTLSIQHTGQRTDGDDKSEQPADGTEARAGATPTPQQPWCGRWGRRDRRQQQWQRERRHHPGRLGSDPADQPLHDAPDGNARGRRWRPVSHLNDHHRHAGRCVDDGQHHRHDCYDHRQQ